MCCSIEIGSAPRVETAANLARTICYDNKDRLMAGLIVAGWDATDGGSVYAITLGGSLVKQDFTIGGSGSTYIYGFCDSYYKPGMSADECRDFVSKALSYAMARDGSSGGVIRLCTIDESGVDRRMIPGDQLHHMVMVKDNVV